MTNPLVEALKPCPFCGSDEVELIGGSVECNGCGTLGPDGSGLIPEHTSIEGWNKRISSFESQPSELCGEFTPSQLERLKRFFESQPSGWISVNTRQPDRVDYYQILTKNEATGACGIKRRFPYNAYWNGESWWGGIIAPIELRDVEYWTEITPLPEPPENAG